MGIIEDIGNTLLGVYNSLEAELNPGVFFITKIILFSIIIVIIAIFIWEFYKTLSRKNLISLNLSQYNKTEHPLGNKLLAIILYLLEYIIIMPILILIWFAALSIVILLIANEQTAAQILFMSAAIVGAIRILAYYHQEISKDLAKLFPFITLSIFILSPNALNIPIILNKFAEIPSLLISTIYYLVGIVIIEIALRIIFTINDFFRSEH